jgi:hypothetical protein
MIDLPPFLNKSVSTVFFKRSGKIPEDNDLLHVWVKCVLMKEEPIFCHSVNISSHPEEF